jgi:hypothetical protein
MIKDGMKHVVMAAALVLISLGLQVVAFGQKGKKPGGGGSTGNANAVMASFAYCTPNDASCESSNRARMDIDAPYVDGVDGVDAWFNADVSGDLLINLTAGPRTVTYDFRAQVNAGDPDPAWLAASPVQSVSVHINVLDAWAAKVQCGNAAACDEHYITRMNGGNWNTGRRTPTNRLQWNPSSIQPFINTPDQTSDVDVHYIKDTNGERFIITPVPDIITGYCLAGLQIEETRSTYAGGQYDMPFALYVVFK